MKTFISGVIAMVVCGLSGASAQSSYASPWQAAPSAAEARHENAFVAHDGLLYLIGGRGDKALEIYDPETERWSKGTPPPIELHHTQAVSHGDKIWIIGAMTGGFPDETPVPNVLTYDPQADVWAEGPALPEGRERGASGLVFHDGMFYLIGGLTRGHMGGYVPWVDAFDPATGDWQALPDAPHARDHFHAVVIDDLLFAAGGRRTSHETGEVFSLTEPRVDVYDLRTGRWLTLDERLPTPRAGTTAIARDGMLYVIGGESGSQPTAHDEVEVFDPQENRWHAFPPLPVGRHGTQATMLDGDIHIVAGSGNRGGAPELTDHYVLPEDY